MSLSSVPQASLYYVWIIDYSASSAQTGLLFYQQRPATSCNCLGAFMFIHLLCLGICAVLRASEHQAGWVCRWRGGVHFVPPCVGWDSQRQTQHTHGPMQLMLEGDGALGLHIKYLSVLICTVHIQWAWKMHYFWMNAEDAPD